MFLYFLNWPIVDTSAQILTILYFLPDLKPWKTAFEISWPFKNHEDNCELYQKLIENGKCGVCKKSFETMQALNMHIGHNHNKEMLALRNQMQEEPKWKRNTVKSE